MGNPFARRHGYRQQRAIVVREDAPRAFRAGLLAILGEMGHNYSSIRELICPVLHTFPDPGNWSEIPNVRDEVIGLIEGCDWFRVYDIAEVSYRSFVREHREHEFEQNLNALCEDLGIGWQNQDRVSTLGFPKPDFWTGPGSQRPAQSAGASLIQRRLESKHEGALHQHRVEMKDYTRQQHQQRALPRMPAEKCEDSQ